MYAVIAAPTARRTVPTFTSTLETVGARTLAALSCAYCVVGTMGAVTPEMMAQRNITSTSTVQYRQREGGVVATTQPSAAVLQPTPAADVARIREVLKPTVLELATLFGVSRQAVYDWQDGAQPNAETAARLAELAGAAEVFANAEVTVDAKTLRRKVAGGNTLLTTVLNGGDARQLAQSLVETLRREDSQRERLSKQLAGRKRGPVNPADYGAPSLANEA